jgi:hypothetical protein
VAVGQPGSGSVFRGLADFPSNRVAKLTPKFGRPESNRRHLATPTNLYSSDAYTEPAVQGTRSWLPIHRWGNHPRRFRICSRRSRQTRACALARKAILGRSIRLSTALGVPGNRSVNGPPTFIDPRAGRAELAPQMNGARSKPRNTGILQIPVERQTMIKTHEQFADRSTTKNYSFHSTPFHRLLP